MKNKALLRSNGVRFRKLQIFTFLILNFLRGRPEENKNPKNLTKGELVKHKSL